MTYPTLTERKRDKVAAMQVGVETLARDLGAYAREHGGRFILYGSAARGELRHDSDIDILVDFDGADGWDALAYAEDRARELGLLPDARLARMSGPKLREEVAAEGRVLG